MIRAAIRTNVGQVGSISGFAAREREKEKANRVIPSLIDLQFKFFLPSPSPILIPGVHDVDFLSLGS